MSEEKSGQGVRVGEYELEGRYHDVGPDLGRLYEAHHVHTGIRGLVLMPGPASKWKLSGPWSVRVAYDPGTPPSAWRIHAPTGLMFLAFVGLGLALGYALRQAGWL